MPLPRPPVPGMVVRYAFLWSHEAAAGRQNAAKDRPCVIVLASRRLADGRFLIRVAPITHSPPEDGRGVALPPKVKKHLGLDADASWVVINEVNQFVWPGVDLRPISVATPGVWTYGILPADLFDNIRNAIIAVRESRRLKVNQRED